MPSLGQPCADQQVFGSLGADRPVGHAAERDARAGDGPVRIAVDRAAIDSTDTPFGFTRETFAKRNAPSREAEAHGR